ncbi:intradiol ring-cleavage dioxygenase [Nocardioides cavernaquae]|uniref:Intradiol ring-cleavage dioxygenase n=1 Tax=Nocardioides cavernaquae TaxID=2321396 RepID=A0A3A5HCP0_9ACTN|nr:intradiol ring-cleavage dioxygenase [Nocardioides cavernaquae]RJS47638.1 intradiol ring-cleavage dioxygenase [Nocardioides cavernaquae]
MSEHTTNDHREGLAHDLPGLMARGYGRRGLLGLLGGVGAATLVVACSADDGLTDVSTAVGEGEIPEETAGPYPGDGSNGPDVLSQSGVVREDITRSFGSGSGVAAGVATTIRLRVLQLEDGESTPLAGAAVYLWHADREGRYSMYSSDIADENYLRGVQVADKDGWLQFKTVFPGCYPGRWPHVHFEVYPSVDDATSASNRMRTTQLALPEATCREVYGVAEGYDSSVANLEQLSLDSDNVFSDGYSLQLAKVTGSAPGGYTATLAVPV